MCAMYMVSYGISIFNMRMDSPLTTSIQDTVIEIQIQNYFLSPTMDEAGVLHLEDMVSANQNDRTSQKSSFYPQETL